VKENGSRGPSAKSVKQKDGVKENNSRWPITKSAKHKDSIKENKIVNYLGSRGLKASSKSLAESRKATKFAKSF
jgi:hypothetical protein